MAQSDTHIGKARNQESTNAFALRTHSSTEKVLTISSSKPSASHSDSLLSEIHVAAKVTPCASIHSFHFIITPNRGRPGRIYIDTGDALRESVLLPLTEYIHLRYLRSFTRASWLTPLVESDPHNFTYLPGHGLTSRRCDFQKCHSQMCLSISLFALPKSISCSNKTWNIYIGDTNDSRK